MSTLPLTLALLLLAAVIAGVAAQEPPLTPQDERERLATLGVVFRGDADFEAAVSAGGEVLLRRTAVR